MAGGRRALLLLAALATAACATLPWYLGPRTSHFDGTQFHNEVEFEEQPPGEVARWLLTRQPAPWPDLETPPAPPPPARVGGGAIRVTLVNHSTVLLQMDSLNMLTDPVWAERIGPVGPLAGTRRHWNPGVRFEDLPRIDVVLLSHDHYDHMDLPTLDRLRRAFHPRIIAPLGNPQYLASVGIPGGEQLDWWQAASVAPGVHVRLVPAQHWSGRTLSDHRRRLWGGFVIEGRRDTVYFAGDTGWGPLFYELRARYGALRLALLPIAPFEPRWYMHRKHESPEDALAAALVVRAGMVVPIHWGTFILGDEPQRAPVDTLHAALDSLPPHCRPSVVVLDNGASAMVPPIDSALLAARDDPACDLRAQSLRQR